MSRKSKIILKLASHSWFGKVGHTARKSTVEEGKTSMVRCIIREIVFLEDNPNHPVLMVFYRHNAKSKTKYTDIPMTAALNIFWINQDVVSDGDDFSAQETEDLRENLQERILGIAPDKTASQAGFSFGAPKTTYDPRQGDRASSFLPQNTSPLPLETLQILPDINLSKLSLVQKNQLAKAVANANELIQLLM